MGPLQEKVLLVNFPENVRKEFSWKLEKMALPLRWDAVLGEVRFVREKLGANYDFVFIYGKSSCKKYSRLLSEVRLNFPLSELFIITAKKDYDMAVEALRMGARDVISFPLDGQEFSLMIQRARDFRRSHQYSRQESELMGILNYFDDIRKFTTPRQIFKATQECMANQFPVTGVRVFHYHFEKGTIRFDFGTPVPIGISPEECLALSREEKKYKIKERRVYLFLFNETDGGSFLLFDVAEEWEILKWGHFFEVLGSTIRNGHRYVKKSQSEAKMSSLAHTDDVTGLYNQRKLLRDLDQKINYTLQADGYFSLIFLDIDNFKNVNDGHGHIIGTKLLVQVAGVIREVIRETDYIYRYGGDEFVIILPKVKRQNAKKIGERLLQRMKHQDFFAGSDEKFKLSLSIGIAEYPRDAQSREDILSMADRMMYKAKKTGRGKVCLIRAMI